MRLLRLAVLVAAVVWAWRHFLGDREPHERATVAYEDGSAIVLEAGSPEFARLASIARSVLGTAVGGGAVRPS